MYLEGLEYTADEWKSHQSTIGVNSEGALRHHSHCYIRSGYCLRVQATQNPSYVMATRVSIGWREGYHTQYSFDRVNAATVSRGWGGKRLIPSR